MGESLRENDDSDFISNDNYLDLVCVIDLQHTIATEIGKERFATDEDVGTPRS